MGHTTDNFTPRVSRKLTYASEYTTGIKHIKEEKPLSRAIAVVVLPSPPLDFAGVAEAQCDDMDLQRLLNFSTVLQFQQIEIPSSRCLLWCDLSCEQSRPYIRQQYQRQVAHVGIRGTQRIISKSVVWPCMKRDIRQWTHACFPYQTSKIHRHVIAPL